MDFFSTYKYITNKQHLKLDTYVPHFLSLVLEFSAKKKGWFIYNTNIPNPRFSYLIGLESCLGISSF